MKKKDIEEEIAEVFNKLFEKHNGVFIFSYSYEKASNGEETEIEGRTGIYGSREVVDILIEEINKVIEENTEDDFVNV